MLVNKMKETAEQRKIPLEVEVVADSVLEDHMEGLDVVLIGPQVRYLEKELRGLLEPKGIKIDVIDQMSFGLMQGDKVLDQVITLLNKE
jgi:PTS system cellobiose-specific IIB component